MCSSVLVNRLSGEIPKELGNITTLTYLYVLNFVLTQSRISWTMDIYDD